MRDQERFRPARFVAAHSARYFAPLIVFVRSHRKGNVMSRRILYAAFAVTCLTLASSARGQSPGAVVLTKDGVAQIPIVAGSVKQPIDELRQYLSAISGAEIKTEPAREG